MNCPNISVKECLEIMREYGFEIGDAFLEEGIKQGVFPFAFAIRGKTWRYFISRHKLYVFLADWCGEKINEFKEAQ